LSKNKYIVTLVLPLTLQIFKKWKKIEEILKKNVESFKNGFF